MFDKAALVASFVRTRWLLRHGSREELLRWQRKRLDEFLRRLVKACPFYKRYQPRLEALPVMNKALCLEHFTELNAHGITLVESTAHALEAEVSRDFSGELGRDVTAGLSSGTSGRRGVFLVGRKERVRWAGIVLARVLSPESLRRVLNPFARPLRIAFFLRANSNLYSTLGSRRIEFRYFDLLGDMAAHAATLDAFQPDILVAPATVLVELAKDPGLRIAPAQVVSVAEVLDKRDAAAIAGRFGARPAQIYQATEGCLGYTCSAGRMHLNEEFLHVECEWLDESRSRFHPVITDFSRNTQYFVRYRLDDVLRVGKQDCACGRHGLVIEAIEGRADEILWLPAAVYPETIRQAIYSAPSAVEGYRVEQHGGALHVYLKETSARLESEIGSALYTLFNKLRVEPPEIHFPQWSGQAAGEKQRRIRCVARREPAA